MRPERFCISDLVGELCCVVNTVKEGSDLKVRCYERDYPAQCTSDTRKGQWVRVIACEKDILKVRPVNVWLGSCNGYR